VQIVWYGVSVARVFWQHLRHSCDICLIHCYGLTHWSDLIRFYYHGSKNMKRQLFKSWVPAGAIATFASLAALSIASSDPQGVATAQTSPQPTATCAFDPNSGKQNPLGMRAFVSIRESDGNTTFVYEQLPSPVGGSRTPVTIAQRRELTFFNTNIAAARQQMLDTPTYYTTLLGSAAPEGFAPVNAVLTCRTSASSSPSPTSPSPAAAKISALPDGNYRYWTGRSSNAVVTDEELLRNGGVLFIFRKTGNQLVGNYSRIDDVGICLSGQINDNTLTGIAVQQGDASVLSEGDRFVSWDPSGLLRVRRGVATENRVQYNSAIADLRGFSRINAGTREPPTRCP
jgi:hypothetical protein